MSKLNNLEILQMDLLIKMLADMWNAGKLVEANQISRSSRIPDSQILNFLQNDEDLYKKILRYEVKVFK